MTVRKAVIPAAGLGTRFIPATKSQPKEMLAVVDKPGIQYVVEEAVRAGVEDILVITSRGKITIEDHFDRSLELEYALEKSGKTEMLEEVRGIANLSKFHYVRQAEPLGFGHAVLMAKEHVGDEPFFVLVGDEIVPEPIGEESALLAGLAEVYERTKASVLMVQEVPPESVSGYGIVQVEESSGSARRLVDMIEKPSVEEAPSNLGARGRYLFTPSIFDAIERTPRGVGNEIQLTDAIKLLAKEEPVYAYVHDGPIYDVGKKLDYLRATIELALRRDDLAGPLARYLAERVQSL